MTYDFEYLMHLIGCCSQGKPVQPPRQIVDWSALFRLANEQQVMPLLAYALKQTPDTSCPAELKERAITEMRSAAISNMMRIDGIMKLLDSFERQGIRAVLLKGYDVAQEYRAPECRISVDTDLWINPKDEKRACEFLKQQGFKVEPRWKNGHHSVCHHPRLGCVELHVILYDEIVEDVWFNGTDGREFVREPLVRKVIAEGEYYALGQTDSLIFLTLHMVKHFIMTGMSLKMILDVALYYKNHAHTIDIDRFWTTLRDLKYDVFIATVFRAMIRYFGFLEQDFLRKLDVDPEAVSLILTDLESGGWMGMKDKENREDGWHAYNRERMLETRSDKGYRAYMRRWQMPNYLKAVFPSIDQLSKRYPYISARPWLVPYAWIHRLIFRGSRYVRSGQMNRRIVDDNDALTDIGRERLEAFRKLGML